MSLSLKVVLIILVVLITVCAALFVSVIIIKLIQANMERNRKADIKNIKPILNKLLSDETVDFFKNHTLGISKLNAKLKKKTSLQTLEDVLLNILEDSNGETKVRVRTIAYHFGFPDKCLSMIRDRFTGNIAIGCRKAGLYQFEDAIPDILKALDILSGNTQYQALMALSRIGDANAMIQGFDKIYHLILVNERAINEILDTFPGDRYKLFKNMIHHHSHYLARLFLKAMDKEIANALIKDIIPICRNGSKETRLAGLIAIGRAGGSEEIPILVRALNDTAWEIRAMAAKTLGVLTGPDAVTPLVNAACDREWWVRQNAVTSILAYPDCEKILISIAQTGDRFAYDSMLYILEKAGETKLRARIEEVWTEKLNSDSLLVG